jgi:hypothetical protein
MDIVLVWLLYSVWHWRKCREYCVLAHKHISQIPNKLCNSPNVNLPSPEEQREFRDNGRSLTK